MAKYIEENKLGTKVVLVEEGKVYGYDETTKETQVYTFEPQYKPIKGLYHDGVLYTLCSFECKSCSIFCGDDDQKLKEEKLQKTNFVIDSGIRVDRISEYHIIFSTRQDGKNRIVLINGDLHMFVSDNFYVCDYKSLFQIKNGLVSNKMKFPENCRFYSQNDGTMFKKNCSYVDSTDTVFWCYELYTVVENEYKLVQTIDSSQRNNFGFFYTKNYTYSINYDDNVYRYENTDTVPTPFVPIDFEDLSISNISSCGNYISLRSFGEHVIHQTDNGKNRVVDVNSTMMGDSLYSIVENQVKKTPLDSLLFYVLPGSDSSDSSFSSFLSSDLFDMNVLKIVNDFT